MSYHTNFPAGTIIQYCVLACALALERHALQAALRRQGAAVQALRSRFPELRELVESLHECRYADFMKSLAWVCFSRLLCIS